MNTYEIKVENLSELIDGMNNAIIAYGDVVSAIQFGCAVPGKLEKLRNVSEEKLMQRFNTLKDIYKQLLEYENQIKE